MKVHSLITVRASITNEAWVIHQYCEIYEYDDGKCELNRWGVARNSFATLLLACRYALSISNGKPVALRLNDDFKVVLVKDEYEAVAAVLTKCE
jgi:hypothetical protein